MLYTNILVRYGLKILFVCLANALTLVPSLCRLISKHWAHKLLVIYILPSLAKIELTVPINFNAIYGAKYFQLTHFYCDVCEVIGTYSSSSSSSSPRSSSSPLHRHRHRFECRFVSRNGQMTLKVEMNASIFNNSCDKPKMHICCKFGDCSSNPLNVIARTSRNS